MNGWTIETAIVSPEDGGRATRARRLKMNQLPTPIATRTTLPTTAPAMKAGLKRRVWLRAAGGGDGVAELEGEEPGTVDAGPSSLSRAMPPKSALIAFVWFEGENNELGGPVHAPAYMLLPLNVERSSTALN